MNREHTSTYIHISGFLQFSNVHYCYTTLVHVYIVQVFICMHVLLLSVAISHTRPYYRKIKYFCTIKIFATLRSYVLGNQRLGDTVVAHWRARLLGQRSRVRIRHLPQPTPEAKKRSYPPL